MRNFSGHCWPFPLNNTTSNVLLDTWARVLPIAMRRLAISNVDQKFRR